MVVLLLAIYGLVFGAAFLLLRWIIQRPWRVAVALLIAGGIALLTRQDQRPQEPAAPVTISRAAPAPAVPVPAAEPRSDASSAPVEGALLDPITDPEIASNLTRQIRRTETDNAPLVVVSLEGDRAWINHRGENLELPLMTADGDPGNTKVGSRFSRQFTRADISLRVQYEVLSSFVIQDMGCERTEYKLTVDVTSGQDKERVGPVSYGEGC